MGTMERSEETEFREWARRRGLADSSVRVYLRTLRRIPDGVDPCSWLESQITADTPGGTRASLRAAVMNLLRFRTGEERPAGPELPRKRRQVVYGREALTETELAGYETVLEESGIATTHRAILRLLPWTALRISELCGVERRHLSLRGADGSPPGLVVVGKGNKVRWTPLVRPARVLVREYLQDAKAEGIDTSRWLFPRARGEGPVVADCVRQDLRSVRDEMPGRARYVTPHVLRHTVATRLHAAGVDLIQLQTILGHADLATTRIYLHPSRSMLTDAFEKL